MAGAAQIAAAAGRPSLGKVLSEWQPTPGVLVACGAAACLYALGVARRSRPWPARRALAWAAGLVAVVVCLESGLDVYSDRLASLHMVQHLALTFVAAPLLAAGAPMTLALGATRGRARTRLVRTLASAPVRVLSRPVSSWLLLVLVIIGWHLSSLYDLSLRRPFLHETEHVLLLTTGTLFWAQVVGVDPLPHRLGPIGRLVYLLAAMPAMSVVGLWLVVSHTVRYPAYIVPTRVLGLSPLHDQHTAGVIMWGGDALLGALTLMTVCAALLQEERRVAMRDAHATRPVARAVIGGSAR